MKCTLMSSSTPPLLMNCIAWTRKDQVIPVWHVQKRKFTVWVFCKLIKMPTLYDCVYWRYTCSSICFKLLTADTPCNGCRGLTGWKSRPSCSTQAWQMAKMYFLISSLTASLAVHCNYIKVLLCVCWSKVYWLEYFATEVLQEYRTTQLQSLENTRQHLGAKTRHPP